DRPGLGLQPTEPQLVYRDDASELGKWVGAEHRLQRPDTHPGARQRGERLLAVLWGQLLRYRIDVRQAMGDALLLHVLTNGDEVHIGRHGLPGYPVPGVEVLLVRRVGRLEAANADRFHTSGHPDRDVHQRWIRRVIVRGVPPRGALRLTRRGPLALGGQPRAHVALPSVPGVSA